MFANTRKITKQEMVEQMLDAIIDNATRYNRGANDLDSLMRDLDIIDSQAREIKLVVRSSQQDYYV